MDIARTKRALLHDLLNVVDREGKCSEQKLMQELFDHLVGTRPLLFHYAASAADKQETVLADILALNDELNTTIQRYKDRFEEVNLWPDTEAVGVRFDPATTKLERQSSGGIHRKPTPHSKALSEDYLELFAGTSENRSSRSTIENDLESLLLCDEVSPRIMSSVGVMLTLKYCFHLQTSPFREDNFLLNDVKVDIKLLEFRKSHLYL